ncbi:hypothetical protein PGB90_009518 [Kerria lacca]
MKTPQNFNKKTFLKNSEEKIQKRNFSFLNYCTTGDSPTPETTRFPSFPTTAKALNSIFKKSIFFFHSKIYFTKLKTSIKLSSGSEKGALFMV